MKIEVFKGVREGVEGMKIYVVTGVDSKIQAITAVCRMRKINMNRVTEFHAIVGILAHMQNEEYPRHLWCGAEQIPEEYKKNIVRTEKCIAVYRKKERIRR